MEMEARSVKQPGNSLNTKTADKHDIDITLCTDPLCCWSWAAAPEFKKLRAALEGKANWRIRMSGLLPDWLNFNDQTNMVTRPAQMGPVWMHAGQVAGRPIQHRIWLTDPPASSYPACVAVKSACLQGESFGASYLHLISDACMGDGVNIGKVSNLYKLAEKMSEQLPSFDLKKFYEDFENGGGKEAFKRDLEFVRYNNINRFPSLIVKHHQKAIMISGYRKYEEMLRAIEGV